MNTFKKTVILITPLLFFAVLFLPYSWANQQFLVKWFGCGCPVTDGLGNIVESHFNANDFTALFWLIVSSGATAVSVLLSKRMLQEKRWHRTLYIIGILLTSLLISYQFYQLMMWN